MLRTLIQRMGWLRVALLLPAAMFAASGAFAASVSPTYYQGNPSCKDFGYDFELRFDPVATGTSSMTVGVTSNTVTITADSANGHLIQWSSNFGIDAVLMKGGPNGNAYVYQPPAESMGDSDLYTPTNLNNGKPYGISHISFCYDKEVTVSKTATTSFDRKWSWTIAKVADKGTVEPGLMIPPGGSASVGYTVTVGTSGSTDSNWAVDGTITIVNSWDTPATIVSVSDMVSPGIAAVVDCGTLPTSLPAGAKLTCVYAASLPDAASRTNTATVTTSGDIGGGTATAAVKFGDPTNLVDECVSVADTLQGSLGTVCLADLPKTFQYTRDITQSNACETVTVGNTASFTTNDTGTPGLAEEIVYVDKQFCDDYDTGGGCTLTLGYWKTHSEFGPAPYDDTWAQLPNGASTVFFSSGKTYYQVFWTAPAGNAYYNLAHQYIAAVLNKLNGASSTAAVDAAMATAVLLFNSYTPAQAAALKGSAKAPFISAATTLGAYNEGLVGPGHCDE